MQLPSLPFNKPYLAGRELDYIKQALEDGKLSGNGQFTQLSQAFLEQRYGLAKALLTTSGTAALEMAALLLNVRPGDEVLVPSFTFTSTANAFVLRGARIVFVDSQADHPNLAADQLEALITPRTRGVVPVHYAGVACDMDMIMQVAQRHNLFVVEDAAQAIESQYETKSLGSFGQLAALSFHETKNIIAGEGGLLTVNDLALTSRAEVLWEKGTNRAAFFRGEAAKYQWIDVGSSFLPSELTAAYLWGQLEHIDRIQQNRLRQWQLYYEHLQGLANDGCFRLPTTPAYAKHNGHIFYLVCNSQTERNSLIAYLARHHILAVFHYQTLHDSPFYHAHHDGRTLPNATRFAQQLVRLPLYGDLTIQDQERIIDAVRQFYHQRR